MRGVKRRGPIALVGPRHERAARSIGHRTRLRLAALRCAHRSSVRDPPGRETPLPRDAGRVDVGPAPRSVIGPREDRTARAVRGAVGEPLRARSVAHHETVLRPVPDRERRRGRRQRVAPAEEDGDVGGALVRGRDVEPAGVEKSRIGTGSPSTVQIDTPSPESKASCFPSGEKAIAFVDEDAAPGSFTTSAWARDRKTSCPLLSAVVSVPVAERKSVTKVIGLPTRRRFRLRAGRAVGPP